MSYECTGKTVDALTGGNYQAGRIRGINAKELNNDFTLTVKEGETALGTIAYSPMTYCYNALSDNSLDENHENSQNAVRALYLYTLRLIVIFLIKEG